MPVPVKDTHTFFPRVINESNTILTNDEEAFLAMGLKHAVPPSAWEPAMDRLVADLESQVSLHGTFVQQCAPLINSIAPTVLDSRTRAITRSIKEKLRVNESILTRADKGQSVVLLQKSAYTAKILEFLHGSGTQIAPLYDFDGYAQSVRTAINASQHILRLESHKKSAIVKNPIPPRLYGLAKIHKDGTPMRSVVSFISAPTYHLAKRVDYWIKNTIDHLSTYAVKFSTQLVQKIGNMTPPANATLISLDVVALFPNLPLTPTINFLSEKLKEAHVPDFIVEELLSLLKISSCLSSFLFSFSTPFLSIFIVAFFSLVFDSFSSFSY